MNRAAAQAGSGKGEGEEGRRAQFFLWLFKFEAPFLLFWGYFERESHDLGSFFCLGFLSLRAPFHVLLGHIFPIFADCGLVVEIQLLNC